MLRGRELRAVGVKGTVMDSARVAEVKAGTLKMPAPIMFTPDMRSRP